MMNIMFWKHVNYYFTTIKYIYINILMFLYVSYTIYLNIVIAKYDNNQDDNIHVHYCIEERRY